MQKPLGNKGKFMDFFKHFFYKTMLLVSLLCEILLGFPHFRPSDTYNFKHN